MEVHLGSNIKGKDRLIKDQEDNKTITINIKRHIKIHMGSKGHIHIIKQKMERNIILIKIRNLEKTFSMNFSRSKKKCGNNTSNNNNKKRDLKVIEDRILMISLINKREGKHRRLIKNRNGKMMSSIKHLLKTGLKNKMKQ